MSKYRGEVKMTVIVPFEMEADDEGEVSFFLTEHYCLSDWCRYHLQPVLDKESCSCYRAEHEIVGIYEVKERLRGG